MTTYTKQPTKKALLLSFAIAAISASIATGQTSNDDSIRGVPSEANHFIGTPQNWEHPVTPWGDPDIQATLNMMQAAGIPLERCANAYAPFGRPACDFDKQWLTDEEFAESLDAWSNRVDRSTQLAEEGDFGAAIQAGVTDPNRPQRQTTLIVSPEDGRLPALTAEGKARALTMKSDWPLPGEELVFNGQSDFDSWDRCITRGMPSSMMPYRYNGGFVIRQAPGYVVLDLEMIHEARVIPIDSDPLHSDIKQWLGGSRGYWDGNTLVIETANYQEGPPMINLAVVGSPPGNRFPISDQMKTVERITRLNDDSWLYEITTEDPVILTGSFTVRYPMLNDPNYWWSEYACHEDNTIVQNFTETNRYARDNPSPVTAQIPLELPADVADDLVGRWVGRPQIATIDLDIELEFTKTGSGTVQGRLIGTTLGEVDKPLDALRVTDRLMNFTMPNTTPWSFAGEIASDGTITGVVSSIQGGMPVTFNRIVE